MKDFYSNKFFLFLMDLNEKMGVTWTYHGNHFTIYVNETIMLYALNLQSNICQSFLSRTGKNKGQWKRESI